MNFIDRIFPKYMMLERLNPKDDLLYFFVKNEKGFMPNLDMKEEFINRFNRDVPCLEEAMEDNEKISLSGYVGGFIYRTYTNYELALIERIDALQDKKLGEWIDEPERRTEENKMIEFYWGFKNE